MEHIFKENKAKVYNFKTNSIEIYCTVLTKEERLLQEKRITLKKKLLREKVRAIWNSYIERAAKCEKFRIVFHKAVKNARKVQFLKKQGSRNLLELAHIIRIYNQYINCDFLSKNNLYYAIILRIFLKKFDSFIFKHGNLFYRGYRYSLNFRSNRLKRYNSIFNLVCIYVVLRRTNIFVTITKNGKVVRIFSPCLFRHITKKGRKKSISYFYTVKRTLFYISRFLSFKRKKKFFFKLYFKGFIKFRRPLLWRFLTNKRLRYKCLGIYNLDFEPFNGCRLKKSKRIKIRGQRKQRKIFSF